MHRYFKKFCFAALACTRLGVADDENAQIEELEERVSALEQEKAQDHFLSPAARPEVRDGADLFVTADLLYWNAHEDGMPLAIEGHSTAVPLANSEVIQLRNNWDFGCRVGMGYNMFHDSWDLYVNWLRFYTSAQRHLTTSGDEVLYPSLAHQNDFSAPNQFVSSLRAHWRLHLNQVDLELGREFFAGKWLTLRPHAGLRSSWIGQKLHAKYMGVEDVFDDNITVSMKNNYWGLGLCGGLDTGWGLGSGWSLYGNGAAAILYGFFSNNRTDESFVSTTDPIDLSNSYRVSRAILDLQLGLRYDVTFARDRVHFGIQAGWEHHIYFDQNQFPNFVNDSTNPGTFVANQGDLTLQGWTLAVRLDF